MLELISNPIVISACVFGVVYLIHPFIRHMAEKNPEQDAWDKLYSISDRVVAYIEQNERRLKYSHKLSTDDKIALKNKAIGMIINEVDPKLTKIIEKNKASGNDFREIVAQVVEHSLVKMKQKYK